MPGARIVLFLPSLAGGGAERVFVGLANDFTALGVPVDLALARAEGPYLDELDPGVRVVDLKSGGVSRSLSKLARHLRTEQPDSILSGLDHANVTAILARAMAAVRTRCVISTRSVPTMLKHEAGAARAWTVLQAARITYRFADRVVANSEGVAADFSRYMRIPRGRIDVIYNPLNIESIQKLSAQPLTHAGLAGADVPMILSAGRLSGLKDFPTLVRAFARVRAQRRCQLVILGEGPDRESLAQLADALQVRGDLLMPGFIGNPFPWMRRAAVFVSSSISEGCPNALMQALACGTPVVSTDSVGGAGEVLERGKWGALVPVGNDEALAAGISATLDTTSRPDVSRRARDFAHEKIARSYLELLLPRDFPRVVNG
jgi:glycosyltransferase involved in cell wall biosynthesis